MSDTINGHVTRGSDSSLYDERCVNCHATDTNSGLGQLAYACPSPGVPYPALEDYYEALAKRDEEAKETTRGLFTGEGAE